MDKHTPFLNVLLIEDSDTDAYIIENAIKKYHGDVVCTRAETFSAGEQKLKEGGVDAVLLDLGLPDTATPRDTYERIKQWTARLPVIIMTNLQDHELARVMVHEGAADFLNKDMLVKDPGYIKKAIDFALDRHAVNRKIVQESIEKDAILKCFMGEYSVSGK